MSLSLIPWYRANLENLTEEEKQLYYIGLSKKIIEEKERELGRKLTACVTTFGCQMNARDSEKLIGILEEAGFEVSDSEEADFVIYNTCTVRDNANQRVYGRLGALKNHKSKNKEKFLYLTLNKGKIVEQGSHKDLLKNNGPYKKLWSRQSGAFLDEE